MQQHDRALAILMRLRTDTVTSATRLADELGVSIRTIYRDVETLSALGVPVVATRGRSGGFVLPAGTSLQPVALQRDEAMALLLVWALTRHLPGLPYPTAGDNAAAKVATALDLTTATSLPAAFHAAWEQSDSLYPNAVQPPVPHASQEEAVRGVLEQAVRAIIEGRQVEFDYRSPVRRITTPVIARPLGLTFERGAWHLVGQPLAEADAPVTRWRCDLIANLDLGPPATPSAAATRAPSTAEWLAQAMASAIAEAPVVFRLNAAAAEQLSQDWFYRHARYEWQSDGSATMTYGDSRRGAVLQLARWLGSDGELLVPATWRGALQAELRALADSYDGF